MVQCKEISPFALNRASHNLLFTVCGLIILQLMATRCLHYPEQISMLFCCIFPWPLKNSGVNFI